MASRSASTIAPHLAALLDTHAPEVVEATAGEHSAMWGALDPALLELCRRRIAMLHGDAAELARQPSPAGAAAHSPAKLEALDRWPDSPHYSPAERACLALTELFVANVASITGDDVDQVVAHLGPAATYGLVQSLLFLDQHQRLALAAARLFDPKEAHA